MLQKFELLRLTRYFNLPLIALRGLLAVALLICSTGALANELTASVDRDKIGLNESFTLTLRLDDPQAATQNRTPNGTLSFSFRQSGPAENLDLAALRDDFEVLQQTVQRKTQVVNGKGESFSEWTIALMPKRAGELTIPPITVDDKRTQPITITVEKTQARADAADRDIFIETEFNKTSAYVQEQILWTVRLYSKVNLDGAEMQPLELPDVVIKAVDESNYITEINNRQHLVLETTFALFPQQSGSLVIPPLAYEVAVSIGQRNPWDRLYGGGGRRQRIMTEEQRIEVNSKPDTFTGDVWLPAKNIELSEHWSTDPENLTEGEPVTRRITIKADGLTAAQLPSLPKPSVDGIGVYPDQPQTEEQVSGSGVSSTSIETLALVPNRTGSMTLPPVTLEWWDTQTGELRRAELPAREVRVHPALGSRLPSDAQMPPQQAPTTGDTDTAQSRSEPVPVNTNMPNNAGADTGLNQLHWWLIGALAALFLALLFLARGYWTLRQELKAIQQLRGQDKRQTKLAERDAWLKLNKSAKAEDLTALRGALIAWARVHWPAAGIQSLSQIAEQTDRQALQEQLRALDAALFGGGRDTGLDLALLVQEVDALRVRKRKQERERESDDLQPLYR